MYNLHGRLKKAEKQLRIYEKESIVFEYTDENGVEQSVEMLSNDFDKLLREISAESKGLPIREKALRG